MHLLREPARRHALTLLFADLCESTRLAAAMEAEQYAELLDVVRRSYNSCVARHGGQVVRLHGDGLLAMFGYPDAAEDDGRRATQAALDLQASVSAQALDPSLGLGPVLNLHSGVHAGQVLVADGDAVRGRFELVGETANLASRLSDAAAAGEVLVSEAALGQAGPEFEAGEREWLTLRGRDQPLAVRRIRAPVRL
jgi:class 3 adenylate cyclase